MKLRNKLFIFFAICLIVITGCSSQNGKTDTSSNEVSEKMSLDTSDAAIDEINSSNAKELSEISSDETAESNKNMIPLNIVALKGPTGMGLAPMAYKADKENFPYSFSFVGSPDEVAPLLIKGDADIAAIPANLAAILNKKTDGQIQILAINTLGVLSIVEKGDSVKSISDLKGKTIYASGKGATPEYVLNYLLEKYGLSEDDVTVEWKSEHSECLAAIDEEDGDAIAMLPQPFVTVAQKKIDGLNIALDLTDEWDKIQKLENDNNHSALITGVVVARKDAIQNHPDEINKFLEEYKQSIEFVNNNIDEASNMIGDLEIFDSNIARAAIPNCHIVYIDGEEMMNKLIGFYSVLFEQNPASIGGEMPASDLFYVK